MQTATEQRLKYQAPSTITAFQEKHNAVAKFLRGPFGSGKSVGAIFDRVFAGSRFFTKYTPEYCKKLGITENIRKRRTLVVRNTWPELRETTLKSFNEWFAMYGHWTAGTKTFKFYDCDHEFVFLGLDRPDDVKKVKSLEISDFILSEASEIDQDIFLGLMGRIGRYPKLKDKATYDTINWEATGICESNPPEEDHWLVEEFATDPKDGYHAFYQPSGLSDKAENRENLPQDYYPKLYEQYAARPDLQTRYVLGKMAVIVRGKPVYADLFMRSMNGGEWHVTTTEPVYPGGQIIRGWDNSGNVPAANVGWVTPQGRWEVAREFVTDRSCIVDFAGQVVEWCQLKFSGADMIDVSDPAGHAEFSKPGGGLTSNAQLMYEEYGIELLKGIQSFPIRREALGSKFARMVDGGPSIRIYGPGCPRLVAGLEGGYAYPKLPDNRGYGNEPIKNKHAHPVESLQYLASYLQGHVEDEGEPVRAQLARSNY